MKFELVNPKVYDSELAKMTRVRRLRLWTRPHMSHINAYRNKSVGGQGLVLAIPKEENVKLVVALDSGRDTWVEVVKDAYGHRFIAHHKTPMEFDQERKDEKDRFSEQIGRPYHPRKPMKAYCRTIGNMPFQEGMVLKLVADRRESYVDTLGYPVSFVCDDLRQKIMLTAGKAATVKVIRAVLSGYDVSAVVVSPYSNRSLVLDDGDLKHHHGAEVSVSFIPHPCNRSEARAPGVTGAGEARRGV